MFEFDPASLGGAGFLFYFFQFICFLNIKKGF